MRHVRHLLTPYSLSKALKLKNRIVMAPMTRRQANEDHTPGEVMLAYYARRAGAGLIVTEGTLVSEDALGYGNVPGIYHANHLNAWKKITEAVHKQDGRIFCQLWHNGRISHESFHQGRAPLSASSTRADVTLGTTQLKASLSRAATKQDIQQIVEDFAKAARAAIAAGFDGIEIHGANGYLIDQFLHYATNQREDEYGGQPENLARFPLALVAACGDAIGMTRVGIRLTPAGYLNDIQNELDDKNVFAYLLAQLNKLNIAYVHTGTFDDNISYASLNQLTMTAFLRQHYAGTLIAAGGYGLEKAEIAISENQFDCVAIGRSFIANPDLIERYTNHHDLIPYDKSFLNLPVY